jgi:3-oxoacyl-[acyl-carrier protein] reductase
MVNLKGKSIVITGASRGIGKAIAEKLAAHGASLALAARTPATLDATVKHIKDKYGVDVIGISTDVGKLEDLRNLEAKATKYFGKIDILVNVAGVSSQHPIQLLLIIWVMFASSVW